MSQEHLAALEPIWWDALQNERANIRQAEQVVFALRRWLHHLDPTLPADEHDGTAWAQHERQWLR